MVGWLENWRVIPISAFNYVIVEVVSEIGKKRQTPILHFLSGSDLITARNQSDMGQAWQGCLVVLQVIL